MLLVDDTPEPGQLPSVYPSRPPVNLALTPDLLRPDNLIAFEGTDGAGKSALLDRVMDELTARGENPRKLKLGRSEVTHHGLERAKWRNSNPMTFSLLSWTSIFDEVAENRAIFNSSELVFFDRYVPTLMVRGILEGLPQGYMAELAALTPQPRLTFLIDCDPEICCHRIRNRGRPISYFEAGARIVAHELAPMFEPDPAVRCGKVDMSQMSAHLVRMRMKLFEVCSKYENLVVIDNSGNPDSAFEEIMGRIALIRPEASAEV